MYPTLCGYNYSTIWLWEENQLFGPCSMKNGLQSRPGHWNLCLLCATRRTHPHMHVVPIGGVVNKRSLHIWSSQVERCPYPCPYPCQSIIIIIDSLFPEHSSYSSLILLPLFLPLFPQPPPIIPPHYSLNLLPLFLPIIPSTSSYYSLNLLPLFLPIIPPHYSLNLLPLFLPIIPSTSSHYSLNVLPLFLLPYSRFISQ